MWLPFWMVTKRCPVREQVNEVTARSSTQHAAKQGSTSPSLILSACRRPQARSTHPGLGALAQHPRLRPGCSGGVSSRASGLSASQEVRGLHSRFPGRCCLSSHQGCRRVRGPALASAVHRSLQPHIQALGRGPRAGQRARKSCGGPRPDHFLRGLELLLWGRQVLPPRSRS